MLNALKSANVISLSSSVKIYVPSTMNVDQEVDSSAMVKSVQSELSIMFGGATAQSAVGGWMSDMSGLVLEKVTIVTSFCTSADLEDKIGQVIAICLRIKNDMQQEAVSLEVNNELYLIQ